MMATLKKEQQRLRVIEMLKNYNGKNPYLLWLKLDVLKGKLENIADFQVEFVLKNYDFQPVMIKKVVSLAPWYQEKKKDAWELDFLPEKIAIHRYFGQTDSTYVCEVRYRKNMEPKLTILSKKGIIENFLAPDYKDLYLDFSPYNEALQKINSEWRIQPHQEESVKFLLTRKKCILSLDMGLGKTMASIVASLMLGNKKTLIVCPASVKLNWKDELMRFIPETDISVIKSPQEMKKEELVEFLGFKSDNGLKKDKLLEIAKEKGKYKEGRRFTILNFDIINEFHQLPVNRTKDAIQHAIENSNLLNSRFDIVIIDEAHLLSNNSSIRFKVLRDFLKKSDNVYTWLLTGTMLTNNTKNLYNILTLIENDLTRDYNYFMNEYCGAKKILMKGEWQRLWEQWNKGRFKYYSGLSEENKAEFNNYTDKYGKHILLTNDSTKLDELKARISHLYFKMDKTEIMKDIKKIIHPIAYTLTNLQRDEYNRLWEEYEKESEKENIADSKQLIEISLFRQYIFKLMKINTIDLVEDLLNKGEKVFIICCFDEEVYGLKDHFGDKSVIFNGKMNEKAKAKAVDLFNNDDNIKIFIGQINACRVGINLNKSCHIAVFQNMDFTDADFSQACDRIFRIGSTKNAEIYLQYYKDTIYEHMMEIMAKKKDIADTVFLAEIEK